MTLLSRPAAALVLFLTAGCARSSPSPTPLPISSAPTRPCDPGSPDSSAWRLVAAKGFTFCLPSAWRVSAQTATLEGKTLRWGTGSAARAGSGERIVAKLTAPAGVAPPSDAESRRLIDQQFGIERETETIGGRPAEVWRSHRNGAFRIGAKWTQPAVWFDGEVRSIDEAAAHLTIIRTVRFTNQ